MIKKAFAVAAQLGAYAGIGAALVQLVVNVQTMVDKLQPGDEHDALAAVLAGPPVDAPSNAFAAGYVDGWTDAAAGLDPKISEPKGADDE